MDPKDLVICIWRYQEYLKNLPSVQAQDTAFKCNSVFCLFSLSLCSAQAPLKYFPRHPLSKANDRWHRSSVPRIMCFICMYLSHDDSPCHPPPVVGCLLGTPARCLLSSAQLSSAGPLLHFLWPRLCSWLSPYWWWQECKHSAVSYFSFTFSATTCQWSWIHWCNPFNFLIFTVIKGNHSLSELCICVHIVYMYSICICIIYRYNMYIITCIYTLHIYYIFYR